MPEASRKSQLSHERITSSAMALADQNGFDAVTIRAIASDLGVKPMAIYHYFSSKEEIVSAMVERVFSEIALPPKDLPWRDALRVRCQSMRAALTRHPWAPPLMESGTSPGPESLRHHEAMLACMRGGGLSWALTAHAYAVLDSFVFGFSFEEGALPATSGPEMTDVAGEVMSAVKPEEHPTLAAFTVEHVLQEGYSFGKSFDFGLDLILDALLDRARSENR